MRAGYVLYRALVNIVMVMFDDRRWALQMWKSRLGQDATYRALIKVFFAAGRPDNIDTVISLLKDTTDTTGYR